MHGGGIPLGGGVDYAERGHIASIVGEKSDRLQWAFDLGRGLNYFRGRVQRPE